MTTNKNLAISLLPAAEAQHNTDTLAALLVACVADGASIGFMQPFSAELAARYWQQKVFPGLADQSRLLLVVKADGQIAGTVQLVLDTPQNQPHRADVSKLLVSPNFRRRGIARALMAALEKEARLRAQTLLTLDTRTDDHAQPLYTALGYQTVGTIPNYCLDPAGSRLDATTVMYKLLT
jgi:hypothetical protein